MKTVQQIYDEYRLMSGLQLHQLRVAAVAKIICDSFKGDIDTQSIILGCLFHDMGNIIKSDLSHFPEFLKPQGLEYWKKVKTDYIKKYGDKEHVATIAIAKEIPLPEGAIECLSHVGFEYAEGNDKSGSFENKICNYSDVRASPHGVVSMEERLEEGRKRYAGKKHVVSTDYFHVGAQAFRNMEKDIFSNMDIKPEDITEGRVHRIIEDLRRMKVC